ncbi:hypothetical protein [Candidatus Williamhamiltonella defendens]|uniref:hypothetical protein n=1 Tax=Candidatus Williamhamiltonella defendens TaxID=138072 RepID=UPI0012FDE7C6|nr:hypothetical protein [Candidatus Hamiltonella defensa]
MVDVVDPATRSRMMSRIRSGEGHRMGMRPSRYRVQSTVAEGDFGIRVVLD